MRKIVSIILLSLLLWTIDSGLWTMSYAAVPHLINYQGRLTDASGKPLDGLHTLTFRIYDAESAGNLLWQGTYTNISISKGIFSILLGDISDSGYNFTNLAFDKPYWLEIKVGNEVMSPRQQITAAGYAIRAEKAEATLNAENAALLDNYDTATSKGANKIYVSDASGYLPDATVDTGALKTATGEVTANLTSGFGIGGGFGVLGKNDSAVSSYTTNIEFINRDSGHANPGAQTVTLPGGQYAFFPQYKQSGDTGYWQTRYVTASGQDCWLFLLIDKDTKNIISAYSAPDHPAYGNGGDFNKVPHPFLGYDPSKYEIILIDNDTVTILKQESQNTGGSLLTLINEQYKVNTAKEEVYKPLHSGRYLTKDGQQAIEMVNTLPSYIKVRKLVKR